MAVVGPSAGCTSIPRSSPSVDEPRTASTAVPEEISKALADSAWAIAIPVPAASLSEQATPPTYRWRNDSLNKLLSGDPPPVEYLEQSVDHPDKVISGNAAIGLARLCAAAPCSALAAAVRSTSLKLPMRRAAAEALTLVSGADALPTARELIDEFGQFRGAAKLSYEPELHAELIRTLGRLTSPAAEPRLLAGIDSPAALVRLAAIEAWNDADDPLPEAMVDLRHDPEAQVRATALMTIARQRNAEAEECITTALADADWSVRQAAIAALGVIGGESACERLRRLASNQPELVRAAAVTALVEADGLAAVAPYKSDKSWAVRQAVAKSLRPRPGDGAVTIARELAADPNPQVQQEIVAAMAEWPLDRAGPVLLSAIDRAGYQARRQAARQLQERWPAAGAFPVDATREARDEAIARLRKRWSQEFTLGAAETEEESAATDQATASASSLDRRLIAELLRQLSENPPNSAARREALARLIKIGAPLASTLEAIVTESGVALPDAVFRDVLAQQDPEFALIEAMRGGDLSKRRRAAERLVERARQAPLPPLAVRRLADVASGETDPAVFRAVLWAVGEVASEPALRLTLAGLSHPHGEIRRRSCEMLRRHGTIDHADALTPALTDPDPGVVRAAVLALARLGRPEDETALAPLLGSGDHSLRLEAAVALARIGSPRGAEALARLAHDHDADIRRRTALALGDLADTAHVPLLIEMLEDHQGGVDRVALDSLRKIVGHDVAQKSGDYTPNPAEQVETWKRWWRESGSREGGALNR